MYKIIPNGFGFNASNILGFREKNFHGSRFNIIRKKKKQKVSFSLNGLSRM